MFNFVSLSLRERTEGRAISLKVTISTAFSVEVERRADLEFFFSSINGRSVISSRLKASEFEVEQQAFGVGPGLKTPTAKMVTSKRQKEARGRC